MTRACARLLTIVVLVGCGTATLCPLRAPRPLPTAFPGGTAYIENPELADEARIFIASGLFQPTDDQHSATRIRLKKLERDGVCGNPYMLTFLTLGAFPAWIPASSVFSFIVTRPDGTEQVECRLPAYNRVSPAEYLLKPFRDAATTRGRILADAYQDLQPSGPLGDGSPDEPNPALRRDDQPRCFSGAAAGLATPDR